METPNPSPSHSSPSPTSNGVLQPLWRPHWLWWLISALSGTLSIEEKIVRLKQETEGLQLENAKYDRIVQQNQIESLRLENESLRIKNSDIV